MYTKLIKPNFLQERWEKASNDLKIKVLSPYELSEHGINLTADVLVKDFGGAKGTLIFQSFKLIKPIHPQLVQLGYGWSILEASSPSYNRDVFIEMLREWEWTGNEADKPDWIEI